jgi:hypothetical protein
MRGAQWIVVLTLAFVCVGCSGRGGNPAAPDNPTIGENPSQMTASQDAAGNKYILSLGTVNVSADHQTMEVVPMRTGEMHLNLVNLLENICPNCFKLSGGSGAPIISPDMIMVKFSMNHPFEDQIQYTLFDVRMVIMTDSDYEFPESQRRVAWDGPYPIVLNPDGYSHIFNPVEYPEGSGPPIFTYTSGVLSFGEDLTATLNPYMAFCKKKQRRMFEAANHMYSVTVCLTPPEGAFSFGYAIDCSWAYVEDPVDPVEDFPPEANCTEPYNINTWVGNGLANYVGSSAPIYVEIFDHQGLDTIGKVTAEAPGLFDGISELTYSHSTGDDSWMYEGTIAIEKEVTRGDYPVLIRAESNETDPFLGLVDAWDICTVSVGADGWAKTWGGEHRDSAWSVSVASNGNIFIGGTMEYPQDLDPGPDITWFPNEYVYDDCIAGYLSKFSPDGDLLKAICLGPGSEYANIYKTVVDEQDNILISGTFNKTVDFDPGDGAVYLPAVTDGDVFFCKYNEDLNLIWANSLPIEYQPQYGYFSDLWDIAVDPYENSYLAGNFFQTMDFDPGPGEDIHDGPGMYIISYDPGGQKNWVQSISSPNIELTGLSFADLNGNDSIITAGSFVNTVEVDPGPGSFQLSSNGHSDAFISIYKDNGDFDKAISWGGTENEEVADIAVDSIGNIFCVGRFKGTVDFNPGPEVDEKISVGNYDFFMCKYDSLLNYQFCLTWGSVDVEDLDGLDLDIDPSGYVLVCGNFQETIDLDPGPGTQIYIPNFEENMGHDFYLSKFDESGVLQHVTVWSGLFIKECRSLEVDSDGFGFVSGDFSDWLDFNPDTGYDIHYSYDSYPDSFLLKVSPDGTW